MRTSAELSIYSRGEIRRRLVGPQMCPIHHTYYRLSLHSLLPNCPSGGHPRSNPGRQISPLQPPHNSFLGITFILTLCL